MNKLLSDNPTISELIFKVLKSERIVREEQANLYALKDKLRNEVQKMNSVCFDNENPDRPVVFVQASDGLLYRLTLSGTVHGLHIDEVTVVKVA